MRTYNLFISHAWHRDEEYMRVVDMLDEAPRFDWNNLSVPEHRAIDPDADRSIEYHLRGVMRRANLFILCAGLYVSHSEMIEFEIAFARRIGRPIVAVAPWGAARLPASAVYAVTTVARGATLVQAIRQYALDDGD
jgi:hypothetical protein